MSAQTQTADIAGYDYVTDRVARSPVTLEQLEKLKETVDFTDEDRSYLTMVGKVLYRSGREDGQRVARKNRSTASSGNRIFRPGWKTG